MCFRCLLVGQSLDRRFGEAADKRSDWQGGRRSAWSNLNLAASHPQARDADLRGTLLIRHERWTVADRGSGILPSVYEFCVDQSWQNETRPPRLNSTGSQYTCKTGCSRRIPKVANQNGYFVRPISDGAGDYSCTRARTCCPASSANTTVSMFVAEVNRHRELGQDVWVNDSSDHYMGAPNWSGERGAPTNCLPGGKNGYHCSSSSRDHRPICMAECSG